MTTVTEAPSAIAGISAGELAAMQDAASAFRTQFTGGGPEYSYSSWGGGHSHIILAAAGLFGALEEPFFPPSAAGRNRAKYKMIIDGNGDIIGHDYGD